MNYDFSKELEIDPAYDPKIDYQARLDAILPRFIPASRFQDMERSRLRGGPTGCSLIETGGPTEYHYADGRVCTMPGQRSARSLDPNGFILYCTTSTCRPGPETPDGDDGIGTDFRVRSEKRKKGWLFLELEDGDSFAHLDGQKYLSWIFEIQKLRVARYEEEQRIQAEAFVSENTRALRETAEKNGAVTAQALEAVAKMNSESIAALAATLGEILANKKGK